MSRKMIGAVKPKKVNGLLTVRTEFYRRTLWRKVKGLFDIKLPDDWDYGYFLNTLVGEGVVAVTDSVIGVRPFICSPFGINYMNNPTQVRVVVPTIMQFERTLGEDAELLFLDRLPNKTYWTFREIVDVYAEKLASADCCIDVNLMNSKAGFIFEAESKAQAETIKLLFDKISEGDPLVVYRAGSLTSSGLNAFFNNLKNNFICDVLQDAKRTIMNEFLTEIGLNNANTDKRERLLTSEVSANNQEILCNTDVWAKNLEICLTKIHNMFPELEGTFDIKLKYREETIEAGEAERSNRNMEDQKPGKESIRRDDSSN